MSTGVFIYTTQSTCLSLLITCYATYLTNTEVLLCFFISLTLLIASVVGNFSPLYSTVYGYQYRDVCQLVCYLYYPVDMPFTSNSLLCYDLTNTEVLLCFYQSYSVDCVCCWEFYSSLQYSLWLAEQGQGWIFIFVGWLHEARVARYDSLLDLPKCRTRC